MKNLNEEEIYSLVDYAIKYYLDISFIEEMPLGIRHMIENQLQLIMMIFY